MTFLCDTIHIHEKNVDGCGGYADVFVQVGTTVTDKALKKLDEKLEEIKRTAFKNGDCLDTDDMVADAMNAVYGEGHWQVVCPHYVEF